MPRKKPKGALNDSRHYGGWGNSNVPTSGGTLIDGVTKPAVQTRPRVGPTRIGLPSSSIIAISTVGAGLDALYGAMLKENSGGAAGGRGFKKNKAKI